MEVVKDVVNIRQKPRLLSIISILDIIAPHLPNALHATAVKLRLPVY